MDNENTWNGQNTCSMDAAGADPGGARPPPPPFSESLGIDFYSGFRKKIQVYTFIVASEKKTQGGGCNSKS